ncbi:ABC transporter substrate-binding protein [Pandoraea capi]|uniref:heme/hemin ABC transporter substrate-binding protein n=1 Tax=Pandoraea TaxID=93217 RepID=UPI001F5D22AB|nr:ABC transporter substrate-binding protein [Pandoraea capi]MCI3207102.1 hemin ABC transporter substrate-binding protein [Pandoraea sp. LA3]MDN4585130.1 hemin ABC transporter substrate-binding protein [Pandoraea capi]
MKTSFDARGGSRVSRRALLTGGATLATSAWLGALWPTSLVHAATAAVAKDAPKRVIVAGGALTEIVYALGAQNRVIANDLTSLYPEAAAKLPKIGYLRTLSAEGVLSLHPDLLLAGAEAGPPNVLTQIEAAGVPVQHFRHGYTAELVRDNIRGVANALKMGDDGARVAARFMSEWMQARGTVEETYGIARRPRVLFILGHTGNQVMVAGQDTAADAMLAYAGAENALRGFNGYRPLTAEAAVAAQPDVLLTTTTGPSAADPSASLLTQPGLANTPAGRARRVVSFDALYLLGFGPRLPQAVADLAKRVHAA